MNEASISMMIEGCMEAFENQNINLLQNRLFGLVRNFNQQGSGRLITQCNEKDRLGECFCMCLMYDWMFDSDIREAWAENGFYCATSYLLAHLYNKQDMYAATLNLFNILNYGEDDLKPKFQDILTKGAVLGNPIFSAKEYAGGAEYLIREFKFFAATILTPIVARYPNVISASNMPKFKAAKTYFEFAVVPVDRILAKLQFISNVIESILNDM